MSVTTKNYSASYKVQWSQVKMNRSYTSENVHPYVDVAGFRLHKTLYTTHIKETLAAHDAPQELIPALNTLLKEENIKKNPHLGEYEEFLRSIIILDSSFVAYEFEKHVDVKDSSFLFWLHLAEDSDWDTTVSTLKGMPTAYMERYVREHLSADNKPSFDEQVQIISKRDDYFGLPSKVLAEAIMKLHKLSPPQDKNRIF